jgi:acyl transferase domain-containing protein
MYQNMEQLLTMLTRPASFKSGSLVALHEACTALRTGQSRMAIVGGTEIILHPDENVVMSSGG